MRAIHQFVAGLSNGDAISNEARVMRAMFRRWGFASDIFCEQRRILPELRSEARDLSEAPAAIRPDDAVLLHLSIGSPANESFLALTCRKAILYHNVTPSHYFDLIEPRTAALLARGREQMARLAGAATVTMADSRYNADEMTAVGYREVHVLPLVLDFAKLRGGVDRQTTRRFDDGRTNVLFVGRCAPNKKIDDALRAFAVYHKTVNGRSRFIHVGSFAGSERYYYYLISLARELGLNWVHFAGAVRQDQLNAFYRSARVFLCMSDHEGFCIPLIESMVHDVPVLAYAAGAVPETLDGAGVLAREKHAPAIAEMIGRLATDSPLRTAVIEAQRARVHRYEKLDLEAGLRERLAPLLAP
jgi:glycosyltransferase involved in cell wall biosynthesis